MTLVQRWIPVLWSGTIARHMADRGSNLARQAGHIHHSMSGFTSKVTSDHRPPSAAVQSRRGDAGHQRSRPPNEPNARLWRLGGYGTGVGRSGEDFSRSVHECPSDLFPGQEFRGHRVRDRMVRARRLEMWYWSYDAFVVKVERGMC